MLLSFKYRLNISKHESKLYLCFQKDRKLSKFILYETLQVAKNKFDATENKDAGCMHHGFKV
jgi:hypothetical protein